MTRLPPFSLSRRALLLGAAAAAALTAALPAVPALASTPVPGGTLRIGFWRDNTALVSVDPFQVFWIEHRVLLRNVVESLTDQDPATGEVIPWLARSWEVSDDGLAYTFQLRDGITFSNGERFDARAVALAYESNKAFVAQVPSVFGRTYLAGFDRAEVLDDLTVRLHLSRPSAGFLQATSTTNLSILAPESYAIDPAERSRGRIIGTGPFILESYTPEVGSVLVRRADYAWPSQAATNRGAAYLERIELRYIVEESVRTGQFVQGQLDLLWPREPFAQIDLDRFATINAQIFGRPLPGPAYNLYPNISEGRPFHEDAVRAAVQRAIDRESYARGLFSPDYPIIQSIYNSTTPYFRPTPELLAYDPDGARALLEEAGWAQAGDGWRYKNGQRLSLTLIARDYETIGDVLIQDQLRQVGIEVNIRVLRAAEAAAALSAGDYDLINTYMTRADPVVLQAILDPRYTNNSALSVNAYTPESRARIEALFDAGLTARTADERRAAYGELQEVFLRENSAFPIYERVWQVAAQPHVQGFSWTGEGFALLNDVWLARTS